ncbi:hypothetical protein QAD02_019562 [Eretmocerus hayati]|uniref:Uncharacterized protein n=1 Tax=Eretmocerus hayati TaxID=131215 RepID=A0ACC2PJK5_9HYME|nr:hypothetical protein QAD02_019562 [Eretmocerus hayati]
MTDFSNLSITDLPHGSQFDPLSSGYLSINKEVSTGNDENHSQEPCLCYYEAGTSSSTLRCTMSLNSGILTSDSRGAEYCKEESTGIPPSSIVCGNELSRQIVSEVHTGTHNDFRAYSCPYCHSKFTNQNNLRRHIQLHTGEYSHFCIVCGKGWTDRYSLKVHMRTHSEERPFSCEICGKSFKQRGTMMDHKKIHFPRKQYPCMLCNRQFSQTRYLKSHMLLHSREKLLKCSICGMKFKWQSSLSNHMRIHVRDRIEYSSVWSQTRGIVPPLEEHVRTLNTPIGRYEDDNHVVYSQQDTLVSSNNHAHHYRLEVGNSHQGLYPCYGCWQISNAEENLRNHGATYALSCEQVVEQMSIDATPSCSTNDVRDDFDSTSQGLSHQDVSDILARVTLNTEELNQCDEETRIKLNCIIDDINRSYHEKYSS